MQRSLIDSIRSNIFYLVLIGLALISLISSLVTGAFAVFYFVPIGALLSDVVTQRIVLRTLNKRFPSFFKKGVFWREGFPAQFVRFFLSLCVLGLLGFKEQFGLTLQNLNESFLLILLVGFPFVALFSGGAFMIMKKGQSGNRDAYLA